MLRGDGLHWRNCLSFWTKSVSIIHFPCNGGTHHRNMDKIWFLANLSDPCLWVKQWCIALKEKLYCLRIVFYCMPQPRGLITVLDHAMSPSHSVCCCSRFPWWRHWSKVTCRDGLLIPGAILKVELTGSHPLLDVIWILTSTKVNISVFPPTSWGWTKCVIHIHQTVCFWLLF